MPEPSSFGELVGENVLSRNNLQPWWEKSHKYFVLLYGTFIILFGISIVISYPLCLTVERDGDERSLTPEEHKFFASYCHMQIGNWFDPRALRLIIVFIAFYGIIASNIFLLGKRISNSVNAYVKAEKDIMDLNLSLDDLKKAVVSLITKNTNGEQTEKKPTEKNKNGSTPEEEIRQIISNLMNSMARDPSKCLKQRSIFIAVMLSLCFLIVFIYNVVILARGRGAHLFECVVKEDIPWNISVSKFLCSESWSTSDWVVVGLYVLVMLVHFSINVIGIRQISRMVFKVQEHTGKGSFEFAKARRRILILAEISCAKREQRSMFCDFLWFLFSKTTRCSMRRLLKTVQGDVDFGNILAYYVINEKSQFVEEWNEIVKGRKWKSAVALLNAMPPEKITMDWREMKCVSSDDLDEFGNNIYYYALNKEREVLGFKTKAAEALLSEDQHVMHEGKETSIKDFVTDQHKCDPTYPDGVKDDLIRLSERRPKPVEARHKDSRVSPQ